MKYWAYVNNEILGPFEKEKLLELPSFSPALLVCPQTPVGEKTEDWKEAATYPELSAIIGSGAGTAQKAVPQAAAPAQETAQTPEAAGPAAAPAAFKPLTGSSIDPVAPADHNFPGVDIAVNRLGKAHAEPAAAPEPGAAIPPAQQAAANFDPMTLSQINRKADNFPGQENPTTAGPAPEPFEAPKPAFTPGAAPELETFSRPAAGAAPGGSSPSNDALLTKLDDLAGKAASKQDLSAALDPLRLKLDQMGEVISSIKNQRFQSEIMDKLAYLENAVGDIKAAMKNGVPPAEQSFDAGPASVAPAQTKEPSGRTLYGTQPAQEKAEKVKEEAEKPGAIVDTGSKRSNMGSMFKKLARLAMTLVLLAAVALGAVIGLKNFGIFDATVFIPFPLPFVTQAPAPQPAAEPAPAEPAAAPAPQPAEQAQQPKAPDVSPEITYFTRTYKAKPAGPTLEDKIAENSAAAGGDYNNVNWQVKQGGEGIFEIAAAVPAKTGPLTYTFVADYGKKTLLPADERGKAAFDALTARPAARAKTAGRAKKPAPAARQKPQARKAAPPKQAAPQEDEYEYVYEDDDGTGK